MYENERKKKTSHNFSYVVVGTDIPDITYSMYCTVCIASVHRPITGLHNCIKDISEDL